MLRQGVVESPFYSRPHSLPNFNSYRYANALYGNGKAGINTKAKPKPMRPLSFENLIVDGGGSSPHGLVSFDHVAEDDPLPTLFFCTVFKGQTGAAVGLSTGSSTGRRSWTSSSPSSPEPSSR